VGNIAAATTEEGEVAATAKPAVDIHRCLLRFSSMLPAEHQAYSFNSSIYSVDKSKEATCSGRLKKQKHPMGLTPMLYRRAANSAVIQIGASA
jgi:hypothetical protein